MSWVVTNNSLRRDIFVKIALNTALKLDDLKHLNHFSSTLLEISFIHLVDSENFMTTKYHSLQAPGIQRTSAKIDEAHRKVLDCHAIIAYNI